MVRVTQQKHSAQHSAARSQQLSTAEDGSKLGNGNDASGGQARKDFHFIFSFLFFFYFLRMSSSAKFTLENERKKYFEFQLHTDLS